VIVKLTSTLQTVV